MNVILRHIILIGIFLLGGINQISANNAGLDNCVDISQTINNLDSFEKVNHDSIYSNKNSSENFLIDFNKEEEEEDKHFLVHKQIKFYSFFFAYTLLKEIASSTLEDDFTVHFNKSNTYTSASSCALFQVFRI